jgi:hypothetical protein
MLDATRIARSYIDTWNEAAAEPRRSLLGSHWTDDASYVDPLMRASGPQQIGELVAAVHQRFPGFRFRLTGTPNGHGDYVRLSWSLGPDRGEPPIEGSDVVCLRDGKIHAVIGFIDRAPAAL